MSWLATTGLTLERSASTAPSVTSASWGVTISPNMLGDMQASIPACSRAQGWHKGNAAQCLHPRLSLETRVPLPLSRAKYTYLRKGHEETYIYPCPVENAFRPVWPLWVYILYNTEHFLSCFPIMREVFYCSNLSRSGLWISKMQHKMHYDFWTLGWTAHHAYLHCAVCVVHWCRRILKK